MFIPPNTAACVHSGALKSTQNECSVHLLRERPYWVMRWNPCGEKPVSGCPFLRVWKSFPHSKTSLRPGREWTGTWQAEVSGFLMAITCAVLTMFLTLLPQVSIATGKNQSGLNPCFHFLDMFWAIMALISFRQSPNVLKRASIIPF